MFNKILGPLITLLPENNRLELIWKLAQVDFRKRYNNDKLGLFWAFLNPLFRLFAYWFAFTCLLKAGRGSNFGMYIFSGLIIWLAFSEASTAGLTILTQKKYLLESIQFKKTDLFYSYNISVFIGVVFNLAAYLLMCPVLGIPFSKNVIFIPLLALNMFLFGVAFSMLLAVVAIHYKDIKHLWRIVILLGFWTAPILIPVDRFEGPFEFLLFANPASGLIINFRHCIFDSQAIEHIYIYWGFSYAFILLCIGHYLMPKHWQYALEKR